MHITQLNSEHAPEYQRLRLEALEHDPNAFMTSLDQEKRKDESEFGRELAFARSLGYLGYYGIFANDNTSHLLGYCHISQSFLPKQEHVVFLFNLYIAAAARRTGIGHQLLNHVWKICAQHGIEIVFASCSASNTAALSFYQREGFRECGRKPRSMKWQGAYDDEVELVREL